MSGAILHGLADHVYRARPELSCSESKLLHRSAAHLKWYRDHPEARGVGTPQMAFGTMVHAATLEPWSFDERYALAPNVNRNSGAWREFVAQCKAEGRKPCMQSEREAAFACAASVRSHPQVRDLLAQGSPEVSFFWRDPATGVECKARADWVAERGQHVLLPDLKTSSDASPDAFRRSISNFGYHLQAQWYEVGYGHASGLEVSPMLFIVVETEPPYLCACYTIDRWFMAQAAKKNHAARALYAHCLEFNEWPGFNPGITELAAPRYALDEDLRAEQREEEYAS